MQQNFLQGLQTSGTNSCVLIVDVKNGRMTHQDGPSTSEGGAYSWAAQTAGEVWQSKVLKVDL